MARLLTHASGGGATRLSTEENKDLIRRYIEAIDSNESDDWSILDDYIAEDFIAHNPPFQASRWTVRE